MRYTRIDFAAVGVGATEYVLPVTEIRQTTLIPLGESFQAVLKQIDVQQSRSTRATGRGQVRPHRQPGGTSCCVWLSRGASVGRKEDERGCVVFSGVSCRWCNNRMHDTFADS